MRTFNVTYTEAQGIAHLQMLDLALKSGGGNVADAYIELRNLIRSGAQAAIDQNTVQLPKAEEGGG